MLAAKIILGVLGGIIALIVLGVVVLALLADNAQRNGRNWFQ